RSAFDEGDLGDVDPAAAEAALAIHEVIAPQAVERFVEAGGEPPLGHGFVVAGPPALQSLGIIGAEAAAVPPFEAGLRGERLKLPLLDQHSAREDIGLDEVRARGISVEQ